MNIFDLNNSDDDEEVEEEPQVKELVPFDVIKEESHHALSRAATNAGIKLDTKDAAQLMQFMKDSRFGHQSSLTMICKGPACDFYNICPLRKIGAKLPLEEKCPVEHALVEQWVSMYMESLDLDPEEPANSIEVHMVYELAGLELIRRRAANELSRNPSLVRNDIVGYSPQGQPIYDDKPSQALLILERHSKIVNKLRDSLLATPKAAAQAGQITSDISTRTANIQARAKAIAESRRSGKSIEDVDFKIIDDEESAKNKANKQEQDKGPGK